MKVIFDKSFEKELLKELNAEIKSSIKAIVIETESARTIIEISNIKKLKGYKTFYRIKFGSYRIGIEILRDTVCFVTYGHRKDFYRYFPK